MSLLGVIYGLPAAFSNSINEARKRKHCEVAEDVVLYPQSRISNPRGRAAIVIGAHSRVWAMLETAGHGGRIEIGHHCFLGENTRVWSAASVKIGNRVLVSHDVNIHDSNSHSTSAANRARHFEEILSLGHPNVLDDVPAAPIVIEDDAWIGFGASILKGVTIGEGAIVGAHALVTKDVAPYTIVGGNPARVIGVSKP